MLRALFLPPRPDPDYRQIVQCDEEVAERLTRALACIGWLALVLTMAWFS